MPCNTVTSLEALPIELLARIFLLVKRDQDRESSVQGFRSPLDQAVAEVFTQVSGHFRNVARGCSLLWTTVEVEQTTSLDRVEAYCSLSGSAPLSLHVHLDEDWCANPSKRGHVFMLLEALLRHNHRWRSLSLFLSKEATDGQSVVAYLCTSPAPNLKSLTLSVAETDAIDSTIAFATPAVPTVFTQGTDGISTLHLRGLTVHIFRPPLCNITTLHLDGVLPVPIAYRAFVDLLTAPRHLTHLSVYGDAVHGWPTVYDPRSAISLPALEYLRIHSNDGTSFQGILLNIKAPLLRSLTLKAMMENDLEKVDALQVSFPQVEELAFCDFDLSEVGYGVIIRMFPSTETFRIASSTLGDSKSFKALSTALEQGHGGTRSVAAPWPQLRTLHIGFDPEEGEWLLQDLLRNRMDMGYPLSRIELTAQFQDDDGDTIVEEWVTKATDGGQLNVDVTTRDRGEIRWPFNSDEERVDSDDNLFD